MDGQARRFDMTLRNYILFGLGLYAAMLAGILVATSGREKLLAAAVSLAVIGPMWMFGRRSWVRPRDGIPPADRRMMKPQITMTIAALAICSTLWSVAYYYERRQWIGVVGNSYMTLCFLYMMYLAKQRWNKGKESGDRKHVT
jgi:hypothetical protein